MPKCGGYFFDTPPRGMAKKDVSLTYDSREFVRLLEVTAMDSKKGMEHIARQQAKLIVTRIVAITPPGGEGVGLRTAKARGRQAVRNDLERLFIPVRKGGAVESTDLAGVHKQNRTRKGTVSRRARAVRVPAQSRQKYISQQQGKVGFLASGWRKAVQKLGGRLPAYARQSAPGDCEVRVSQRGIFVRMRNAVRYAGDQWGLERRILRALREQENALGREVEKWLAKKAARAAGKAAKKRKL